jgi:hypothetical protein
VRECAGLVEAKGAPHGERVRSGLCGDGRRAGEVR